MEQGARQASDPDGVGQGHGQRSTKTGALDPELLLEAGEAGADSEGLGRRRWTWRDPGDADEMRSGGGLHWALATRG